MRLRLALFSALLLPALLAPAARASVVMPLGLDSLIDGSDRIALGRVESQVSRWTTDHSAIYTDVTVRVLQPLKGEVVAGGTVTVRREGGVVGNIGMKVSGAARFAEGEEVLVFLERRGEALWTVGMAQGKMRVASVAGQRVAIRSAAGMAYTQAPAVEEPVVQPLDAVMARIAARAGGR